MGLTEALLWWEVWQLRILVLCSLFLQCFLFFAGALRKRQIPAWSRFLIWLAYLGSDALAIYALATLFNRQKKQECVSTPGRSMSLQVLWAPILLVHLGGQSAITAYNIEDNELWRRYVLTAGSQVTVAIYVFCTSWSEDKRILRVGILLFFFGIFKCIMKPMDLKNVSINSLVDHSLAEDKSSEIKSLNQYIQVATEDFQNNSQQPSTSCEDNPLEFDELYGLFVDLAPLYSHRLTCLKNLVRSGERAHFVIRSCLSLTFNRLYTKEVPWRWNTSLSGFLKSLNLSNYLRALALGSLFLAIIYFYKSTKETSYNNIDVKITYALLLCAVVLEFFIANVIFAVNLYHDDVRWYLARNKSHRKLRKLASLLACKDYMDQLWCMKPPNTSRDITKLVHDYVTKGWAEHHIKDVETYRAFNDNRGQFTLEREGCVTKKNLRKSLRKPFDESVLLWHLATDFCFHLADPAPSTHQVAHNSKEMSNYMAYLLFVNPEMLMTGASRLVFRNTYFELKNMPLDEGERTQRDMKKTTLEDEKDLAMTIAHKVQSMEGGGLVQDAWVLTEDLMDLGKEDEEKMWRVIQGVWVEMLCFSAGRCRGYLHAKSLGKGGEYLSYVWLLLLCMGMETLAEKMQRTELQEELDEGGSIVGKKSNSADNV
ncbi:unnamed protein product [Urochloa decumbens]|uniref:DUF4220 domain-containing protein n=1 Tax=Urochloa decumbens TaxID=240449 RepID=A0ABC9B6N0_9POAL